MLTVPEMVAEARRLSERIDAGVVELSKAARAVAEAEHAYRLHKAKAWLEVDGGTVPERQAQVDGVTAGLRRDRDLAEGKRLAALEALRSRRQQLSALQTIVGAARSEVELARFGPEVG